MNSKQRVITALTRKGLPDRVPLQFDLCRSLADQFSRKYGIPTRRQEYRGHPGVSDDE